jgi:hypothetical protein
MKISVKELRQIIQEVLSEDELLSSKIRKGDIVAFIQHGKKLRGKVIDGYKSTHADPTRVNIGTSNEMIWAVDVGGKIYHKPAGELDMVKSHLSRFGNKVQNDLRAESWFVHNEDEETTDEFSNTMSRMTLLHSDEEHEEELEEGFANNDTSSTPEDENRREDKFNQKKYELLARSIIFRYPDKGEGMNWKTVASNYVRAKRASTGRQLDVNKLYNALVKMLDDMREERTHIEQGQSVASY